MELAIPNLILETFNKIDDAEDQEPYIFFLQNFCLNKRPKIAEEFFKGTDIVLDMIALYHKSVNSKYKANAVKVLINLCKSLESRLACEMIESHDDLVPLLVQSLTKYVDSTQALMILRFLSEVIEA